MVIECHEIKWYNFDHKKGERQTENDGEQKNEKQPEIPRENQYRLINALVFMSQTMADPRKTEIKHTCTHTRTNFRRESLYS